MLLRGGFCLSLVLKAIISRLLVNQNNRDCFARAERSLAMTSKAEKPAPLTFGRGWFLVIVELASTEYLLQNDGEDENAHSSPNNNPYPLEKLADGRTFTEVIFYPDN